MCMLTFFPPAVMPDTDALANGATFNDDGHGFAIVTERQSGKRGRVDKRIVVQRSMDAEFLIAEFALVRRRFPDGPALFHSRLGTHGKRGKANCHPFRVGGDRRTVLAHNGVLPVLVQPRKGDKRSDTRIAAEDYLPRDPFGSLTTRPARKRLADWLTPANKFVILTVDPRYRSHSYIMNESSGIWDGGIWYSNKDYQYDYRYYYQEWERTGDPDWWDESYRCTTCTEYGTIGPVGFCGVCGTCADCFEHADDCGCYAPPRMKSAAKDSVEYGAPAWTL